MGIRLIQISVVYFLIGIGMGMFMSITHDFKLTPVHVHINLLGWTSLTLAGLLYHVFPHLAASRLGKVHAWLHNIGLPIMMGALAFLVYGYAPAERFVALGSMITAIGIVCFVINVLVNLKARAAAINAPSRNLQA